MKVTGKAYAVLHVPTGNLIGNLVNPPRIFWTSYARAQAAINNNIYRCIYYKGDMVKPEDLKIVTFSLDANEKI